jgi:hypothetical protein
MSATAAEEPWVAYNFAVLRVVPHVHLGTFVPVGIVLHARTLEYLAVRLVRDPAALGRLVGGVDLEVLVRYLDSICAICAGDPAGGPVALAPPSERFHWLTAPRSDVIQSSAVHEGIARDPTIALDDLYMRHVAAG